MQKAGLKPCQEEAKMKTYVVTVTGHFMKTFLVKAEDETQAADESILYGKGIVIYEESDPVDVDVTEEKI